MHKDLPDSAVAALLGVAGEALHMRKVSGVCLFACKSRRTYSSHTINGQLGLYLITYEG